jgi:outer membrane protein
VLTRFSFVGCALAGLASAGPPPGAMTLERAFALARVRSDPLRIADANLALAQVGSARAWSTVLPKAQVQGTGQVNNSISNATLLGTPIPGLYQQAYQGFAQATLDQPLFRRGFGSALDAVERDVESALQLKARAQEQLALDVATAYLGTLRSRRVLEIADTSVSRANGQRDAMLTRVQAGSALRSIGLQATVYARRSELSRVQAQNQLKLEELAFQRLVGVPPPAELRTPRVPEPLPPLAAYARAKNRSDLASLRALAERSRSLEEVARGNRIWPYLDLQGFANLVRPLEPSNGYTGENYAVSAVLTVPLYQGGTEYVQIREQEARTRLVDAQASDLQKEIDLEVGTALSRWDAARQSEELALKQVRDAAETYELVSVQAHLRPTTFLELASAQDSLSEAETDLADARYEKNLSLYALLFATGGLSLGEDTQ